MHICKNVTAAIAIAFAVSSSSAVMAARYELSAAFAVACEGVLDAKEGFYFLVVENEKTDPEGVCNRTPIAAQGKHRDKYLLGDKVILQVLRTCTVGKPCKIVGYMRGFSHEQFFWSKIDSVLLPTH